MIVDMNIIDGYKELMDKIGYTFKEPSLLIKALSHSSYVNELKLNKHDDYERQEFLGDAVLELTVSDFLFKTKSTMREGDMTKLRAALVCEPTLSMCAKNGFDLPRYLLLGKGEDATGGRSRDSIIADVFEAIVGAIYLDGGLEAAAVFINKYVLTNYEEHIVFSDSKTILQEYAQERQLCLVYELVEESGPSHDRDYRVKAILGNDICAEGMAKSKKSAEQHAAYAILKKLQLENGV